MTTIHCVPMTGINYKTAAAVKKAWDKGVEFESIEPGYMGKIVSKREIPEDSEIVILFNQAKMSHTLHLS